MNEYETIPEAQNRLLREEQETLRDMARALDKAVSKAEAERDEWRNKCQRAEVEVKALEARVAELEARNPTEDGVDALGLERGQHQETMIYLRQEREANKRLEARVAALTEAGRALTDSCREGTTAWIYQSFDVAALHAFRAVLDS